MDEITYLEASFRVFTLSKILHSCSTTFKRATAWPSRGSLWFSTMSPTTSPPWLVAKLATVKPSNGKPVKPHQCKLPEFIVLFMLLQVGTAMPLWVPSSPSAQTAGRSKPPFGRFLRHIQPWDAFAQLCKQYLSWTDYSTGLWLLCIHI